MITLKPVPHAASPLVGVKPTPLTGMHAFEHWDSVSVATLTSLMPGTEFLVDNRKLVCLFCSKNPRQLLPFGPVAQGKSSTECLGR